MDPDLTVMQAIGLRRVAANLDQDFEVWCYTGNTPSPEREEFSGEDLASWLFVGPIFRALAAELVLKAICIKTVGAPKKVHNLIELFEALDWKIQNRIEEYSKSALQQSTSIRSILDDHADDFTNWRYIGEKTGIPI